MDLLPALRTLWVTVDDRDEILGSDLGRSDQHEDVLTILLEPAHRRRGQARGVRTQKPLEVLGEVIRRDALDVEPGNQVLEVATLLS